MMKRFLKILLLATVVLSSCKKSKPVETEPEKKLVMIEGILTPFKNGQPNPAAKFVWSRQEFNEDGQLHAEMVSLGGGLNRHSEKNRTLNYYSYKYQNGKMVSKYKGSVEYKYTYNGNDTTQISWYDHGFLTIMNRHYKDGKLVKEEGFYDGKLSHTGFYYYDTKGFLTKVDLFPWESTVPQTYLYTTNEKGDILRREFLISDGIKNLRARYNYKYDANGILKEYTFYSLYHEPHTPNPNKYIDTFDKNKNLIRREVWESNEFEGPFTQIAIIDYTYSYK